MSFPEDLFLATDPAAVVPLSAPAAAAAPLPHDVVELQQEVLALRSQVSELRWQQQQGQTAAEETQALHAAFQQEQALRRQAEEERAVQSQRADQLASDRRAYRLRLKEAAAAYAEVKTTLKRLQDEKKGRHATTQAAVVVPGLQTQQTTSMAPALAEPDEEDEGLEAFFRDPCPTMDISQPAPQQQPLCHPPQQQQNTAAIIIPHARMAAAVHDPSHKRRSPLGDPRRPAGAAAAAPDGSRIKKPAWKKAVRKNDIKEDDGFLYDPAGPSSARAPMPSARPSATGAQQRQQQQPTGTAMRAAPALQPGEFKHQEVVRKKNERAKLPGFECNVCRRFFDAIQNWDAMAELPECDHGQQAPQGGENGAAAGADWREQLRDEGSRHRYRYEPPPTPQGFWDLGFPTPPEYQ